MLMKTFLSYNLILPKYLRFVKEKRSLNPKMRAQEGGASIFTAFLYSLSASPPASPKKLRAKPKQAGKKEGGLGEGIFARLLCRAECGLGWEAARPCVSKEAKPAKIVSLIEKFFSARPLKNVSIFAGFACLAVSGASRWAGFNPQNPLDFAQKKLEFRPNSTAILRFRHFGKILPRGKAARQARSARQSPILQRFATLRAAKKKCFGFGVGSSFGQSPKQNEVLPTNLFSFRLWRNLEAIIF